MTGTRPRPPRRGPDAARGGGCSVRARFSLSELPVVAVQPPGAGRAGAVAVRVLAAAGRGYLGGLLHLRTYGGGPARPSARFTRAEAAAQRRAAALAVASALRGGRGTARVRVHCPPP